MEAQPSPREEGHLSTRAVTRDVARCALALALVVLVGVASAAPAAAATSASPETNAANASTPDVANATSAAGPTISSVTFSGPAVVDYNGSIQRFLWEDENQSATVTLDVPESARDTRATVCLTQGNKSMAAKANRSNALCRNATLKGNSSTVGLSSTSWPFNESGKQDVTVSVSNDSAVSDRKTVEVFVVEKSGDLDDDSLSNRGEVKAGTNMTVSDSDGDSLSDGAEVKKHDTDPLESDTDDDGARDAREVAVGTDPTEPDTDGDGISDGEELDKGMNPLSADSDEDGLADQYELELGTDPSSADTDNDGVDDAQELANGTDPTLSDTDDDGVTDAKELEIGTDPTDWDSDGDFLSDGHEQRLGTNPTDALSPFGFLLAAGVLALFGVRYASTRIEKEAVLARLDWLEANANDDADESGGESSVVASADDAAGDSSTTLNPVHDVPRPDAPPDATTPPVMTDEERVKQLLHEHGGRLQQTTVIEETDWSKSKVSRLLSKMEDDGQIRKISVGRENLIAYPEETTEDSTAPPR